MKLNELNKEAQLDEGLSRDVGKFFKELGEVTAFVGTGVAEVVTDMFKAAYRSVKGKSTFQKNLDRVKSFLDGDKEFEKLVANSFEKKGRYVYLKKGASLKIKKYMKDRLPEEDQDKVGSFYNVISKLKKGEIRE